jgi:hypothetical protein
MSVNVWDEWPESIKQKLTGWCVRHFKRFERGGETVSLALVTNIHLFCWSLLSLIVTNTKSVDVKVDDFINETMFRGSRQIFSSKLWLVHIHQSTWTGR